MRNVATSIKPGATPHDGAPVVVAGAPFTAASHQHQEPGPIVSKLIGGNQQQLDPINVPSFGFLRHLFIDVTCTGGVAGPGVLRADAPWNIIQSLTLLDVNGAPIVGPLDGWALMQANLAGGYAHVNDPRLWPGFSIADVGNPSFQLRVPVEITEHNALGAIANQNAAAPYQLIINLNNTTGIYSTNPTTPPTVQVKITPELWTLPAAAGNGGQPQNQLPVAHGTGQFWSSRTQTGIAAGDNTIPIVRVGSLLRVLTLIARDAGGLRSDAVFPDTLLLNWDGRQLVNEPLRYRIQRNFEQQRVRDTGVISYLFNTTNQMRVGDESPNLWLPTQQSTRLELNGNFKAPGSIQTLVNDIQPIEVNPDARYAEQNVTTPGAPGVDRSAPAVAGVM